MYGVNSDGVILDRELVPTSRFDHFYRSDLISIMHQFLIRGLVGNCLLNIGIIVSYPIILVYLCAQRQQVICTQAALCQMLSFGKNHNMLDWSNCNSDIYVFACVGLQG